MGKNVNINFSRNFDIFAIKMTYLNALLSFLLSSCFSARSVAEQDDNRKDNKALRYVIFIAKYQNFGANIYVKVFSHTNLCKFKPL